MKQFILCLSAVFLMGTASAGTYDFKSELPPVNYSRSALDAQNPPQQRVQIYSQNYHEQTIRVRESGKFLYSFKNKRDSEKLHSAPETYEISPATFNLHTW